MSEGAVIEGKNSITLNNCQMTVSNTRRNSNAQFLDGIMIYQSFSGDADSGNSHFTMNGGTLKNCQGHLIHVTNTDTNITSFTGDASRIKLNGHRLWVNGKELK